VLHGSDPPDPFGVFLLIEMLAVVITAGVIVAVTLIGRALGRWERRELQRAKKQGG